jgi:hypothetical protein
MADELAHLAMSASPRSFKDVILLVLAGKGRSHCLPKRAVLAGFTVVIATWWDCNVDGGCVVIRNGFEICRADGQEYVRCRAHLEPAIITVTAPEAVAAARGRELVAGSRALWAHVEPTCLERILPTTEFMSDAKAAFGLVRFSCRIDPIELRLLHVGSHSSPDRLEIADNSALSETLQLTIQQRIQAAGPSGSFLLHRTLAPAMFCQTDGVWRFVDPLREVHFRERAGGLHAHGLAGLDEWLAHAFDALVPLEPLDPTTHNVWVFGSTGTIATEQVPGASFEYLDPDLVPLVTRTTESRLDALMRTLCRRRTERDTRDESVAFRRVEVGVGRAVVVDGLQLENFSCFRDFTVLGTGLTPFSENGFIDIGRKIDGKASLIRARHRKSCSERLERAGCRTGKIVAIVRLPADAIELVDGSLSPAGLVVRAFRCATRVKQLDPIVNCLHSVQHTPLVAAFLLSRLRAQQTGWRRGLQDDEAVAQALEAQSPTQESLRALLESADEDPKSVLALVRRSRRDVIDACAPGLLRTARQRLASDLFGDMEPVDEHDYLAWFARELGAQLAKWRRLRFLHDYHHPGISRWRPGTLYSLGENNVTLLAEFPDLDTAVFVDDDAGELAATLQLIPADIETLRQNYPAYHERDVVSAEAVVRTLAMILFPRDKGVWESAMRLFRDTTYG